MLDTMTSWFSVSDALTRVAVMVCVVCVTGGQLGAVQGPVKTYSFEGVESIMVVQCDGVGNDVVGVKIYESERESKDLVIAGDKKSGLICVTNSSFTACTVQRGVFNKNISVRVIITDLEPGEVREYTCGINRDIGDGIGSTAAKYHHINVTGPEVAHTPIQFSPTKHLGPMKAGSFEGVESIRVVQCDGVGNDVKGVKIYEEANESKVLVSAGEKDSGLICTTNSSFTACKVQRGDSSKNISVRVIITDLEPGEVREYTCGIKREIGDSIGSTASNYHHINVTRPVSAAGQGSSTAAYIAGGVVAAIVVVVVAVVIVVIFVKRYKDAILKSDRSRRAQSTGDKDRVKFPQPRVESSGSRHYHVALPTQENDTVNFPEIRMESNESSHYHVALPTEDNGRVSQPRSQSSDSTRYYSVRSTLDNESDAYVNESARGLSTCEIQ